MEPRHPPVPYSATHAQSHRSGQSSPADTDCDSEYNEKDACPRKDSTRPERVSKSSKGRAHDSVLSPFSPKASAPPSPSSSISGSVAREHRSSSAIQETYDRQSHRISYPPRAHLDPEKAAYYDSPRDHRSLNRASVPDAAAVVYDKSEYHEKGPEDKAWQLLVRVSSSRQLRHVLIHTVLPLRSMCASLHRNYLLDRYRNLHLACALSPALVQQPPIALHPTYDISRTCAEPPTPPRLLIRLV
jgi:hypothetical protein